MTIKRRAEIRCKIVIGSYRIIIGGSKY